MSKTSYAGIDYGYGITNIDRETGIRFGVINQNHVGQAWFDEADADYGPPTCPKCGREADKPEEFGETFANGVPTDYAQEAHECNEYVCVECKYFFGSESAFGDSPIGFYLDEGIQAHCGDDGDILVTRSPYFTYAQYCSPCAPGACDLVNPLDEPCEANRAYCFGHDWFQKGVAPYPVYSVETGELIEPEK